MERAKNTLPFTINVELPENTMFITIEARGKGENSYLLLADFVFFDLLKKIKR